MPRQVVGVAGILGASSHGIMIMPPSRNSIDAETSPWNDGSNHTTGTVQPYDCFGVNGTDSMMVGQGCFWFSQGCTPGCKVCSTVGIRYPNFDHCPDEIKDLKPTDKIEKEYWAGDIQWEEGSTYDVHKFNPWRHPGKAPVSDACGMAGGQTVGQTFNAGEYNPTKFAKIGDLGSKVLKPRPSGTVWRRGGTAQTRFTRTADHAGGYQFRLCPSSEPLTEECFQRMPLQFATRTHVIRFGNSSRDIEINATDVTHGGGIGWRRMPTPQLRPGHCDYNATKEGEHCPWRKNCPGCGPPTYAADESCPGVCSEHFPGTPDDRPIVAPFPDPLPGVWIKDYAVEDTVAVPADIPAGEYILGWRWDCEQSSQVWSSCADITIADSDVAV